MIVYFNNFQIPESWDRPSYPQYDDQILVISAQWARKVILRLTGGHLYRNM